MDVHPGRSDGADRGPVLLRGDRRDPRRRLAAARLLAGRARHLRRRPRGAGGDRRVRVAARGWPVGTFLDCCVPGLALGQAIGRWGNNFNQELFGGPTSLPWGLHVDPAYRPLDYLDQTTFHPVFLYESLWDITVFFLLLALWPRLWERFPPGRRRGHLPDPLRRRPDPDRGGPDRRHARCWRASVSTSSCRRSRSRRGCSCWPCLTAIAGPARVRRHVAGARLPVPARVLPRRSSSTPRSRRSSGPRADHVLGSEWGARDEVGPLRAVLMRELRDEWSVVRDDCWDERARR